MQQRPITISSRAPDQRQDPPQAYQCSPRSLRTDASVGQLPLYFRSIRRVDNNKEKLVHAIPVIVFLCFFILWWFSSPVDLVVENGKIVAIHHVGVPLPLNNHVELAILAFATSPVASAPQNVTVDNEAEAYPVSMTE